MKLRVERIGGLAGLGGKNSRLRSTGEIDSESLSEEDKNVVENLFLFKGKEEQTDARDTFRYRISRTTSKGLESVEVSEEKIPHAVRRSVRDEFA